jgi:chromate transporter
MRTRMPMNTNDQNQLRIPFSEAVRVWWKIGLLSFGGPAGQIALMHRILVEEKKWISEERFMHALNYCMLLPGPEAQQLACYIGWLLHRTWGGVVAGALFVIPGFIVVWLLSLFYVFGQQHLWVAALFYGLKPAVIAIVIAALVRVGKKALTHWLLLAIALTAWAALALAQVSFPYLIISALMIGFVGGRYWPHIFRVASGHRNNNAEPSDGGIADIAATNQTRPYSYSLKQAFIWLTAWGTPIIALWWWLGKEHLFTTMALFFSQAALVTFGGAYAVLTYLGQEAVNTYGWMKPHEMLDGLGLAETAPGPLIKVVQFVGFIGAFRAADPGLPAWLFATLAALLVTYVTFIPSYLYIFVGAPLVERMRQHPHLMGALSAVTAAVVGVIANLALWFSLHTIFTQTTHLNIGTWRWEIPIFSSCDYAAVLLATLASIALIRYKLNFLWVLAGSIVLGMAWFMVR